MKVKTSELIGADLDRAVAKGKGMHVVMARGGWFVFDSDAYSEFRNDYDDSKLQMFRPSTNWAQGGPIIERERIAVKENGCGWWFARVEGGFGRGKWVRGDTPLIAAMRCYVASKLGDKIEIPEELKGE